MEHTLADILEKIDLEYRLVGTGSPNGLEIRAARSIHDAEKDSISWISPAKKDKMPIALASKAGAIFMDGSENVDTYDVIDRFLVIVDDPKLAFIQAVKALYPRDVEYGIHPMSSVHPEAEIAADIFIGPFTYVGRCKIGSKTMIFGNCYLYDGVTVGENVVINAGTVIGSDGFGYVKDDSGNIEKFPHVGGVVIEDFVEIGANTCIDKGTLGNTYIGENSKVDNLVHIAHNVQIGRNCYVIANAMIGGSTIIEDNSWIAPSASLRDGIRIGSDVTVGMGSVVTKDIPPRSIWTGAPARPIDEFVAIQKKIKDL